LGYRAGIIDQEKQSDTRGRAGARLVAALLAALLALGVSACGDSANGGQAGGSSEGSSRQVVGAGSTTQEVAQEHWTSEYFLGPRDMTVSYEPDGSYEGIERFLAGEVSFAGSDVPLAGGQLKEAEDRCRPGQAIEIPVYISPLEVAYNLHSSGMFFSPQTLVKIFDGGLSRWDDIAIRRQNPTISVIGLPKKLPIAPVYRAGDSAATQIYTEYLAAAAPGEWTHGASASWPLETGEAAEGTKGAVEATFAREGSVTYVDSSQRSSLGVVSVKVGPGYVQPNPVTAAAAFARATEDKSLSANPYMLPFKIDRKGSPGAYPLTVVSYLIACTHYDSPKEAAAIKGYLDYAIGREGQQASSQGGDSVPLPASLLPRVRAAVEAIE
jgi:phosphate transport system substrate-binding protein